MLTLNCYVSMLGVSIYFLSLSLSLPPGRSIGSLFHMADDLGRAMESLVSVMTHEQSAKQQEALPY